MHTHAAIPAREDGTDRLGTEGVMLERYESDQNALRYFRVRRDRYNVGRLAPFGWNVYRIRAGQAYDIGSYVRIGFLDSADR
jgi:hypothetical protein